MDQKVKLSTYYFGLIQGLDIIQLPLCQNSEIRLPMNTSRICEQNSGSEKRLTSANELHKLRGIHKMFS